MRKIIKYLISILTSFIWIGTSFAVKETSELTKEALTLKGSPVLTIGYVFQVFLSLAIVIGLIYIVSKYLLPKLQIPTRGRLIQIVERVGLEPQVTAYILKVKEKSWLVVAGKGAIRVVDKLDLEKEEKPG